MGTANWARELVLFSDRETGKAGILTFEILKNFQMFFWSFKKNLIDSY